MKIKHDDGTITEAVGYLDVGGGLVFGRSELAEALPDIDRFERWLEVAKASHAEMADNGGHVPAWTHRYSDREIAEIGETICEIGQLAGAAARNLAAHARGDHDRGR